MRKMRSSTTVCLTLLTVLSLVLLSGCATNIAHIPKNGEMVPKSHVFGAPFERVWSATQHSLAEDQTFRVSDKTSRIMVTDMRPVDGKELSFFQIYFWGKTYQSSYTVYFNEATDGTGVTINVKLQAVQLLFLTREETDGNTEAYLRKKLMDKIAANLQKM